MDNLNIENWNRKKHYEFFRKFDYPCYNVCMNLDITKFISLIKTNNLEFFASFLYCTIKTANEIKEFRYRIRKDQIVIHDIVSPSFTVLSGNEVFDFCYVNFNYDFNKFRDEVLLKIKDSKNKIDLYDEPNKDDLIYVSSLPWITFTSISHPIHLNPVDSIPRITFGKYFEDQNKIKIPISVQVNHALMDGYHVGLYFQKLQEILNSNFIFKD